MESKKNVFFEQENRKFYGDPYGCSIRYEIKNGVLYVREGMTRENSDAMYQNKIRLICEVCFKLPEIKGVKIFNKVVETNGRNKDEIFNDIMRTLIEAVFNNEFSGFQKSFVEEVLKENFNKMDVFSTDS